MEEIHAAFLKFMESRSRARDKYDEFQLHEATEYGETMRAVSLACGALATGILVLLSTEVAVDVGAAIASVTFLAITSGGGFFLMVQRHRKNFKRVFEYKEKAMKPMDRLNLEYLKFFTGKITQAELNAKVQAFNLADIESTMASAEENIAEVHKDKPWSGVLCLLMLAGIMAFVASLLLPYVPEAGLAVLPR